MKVHVVIEIVYGNEGCPSVRVFDNILKAKEAEDSLNAENGPNHSDVLVICEEVEVE